MSDDNRLNEYRVDEYRALRDEVMRNEREELLVTFYVLTIAIGAVGLAHEMEQFARHVPYLYFVVIIWGLHRYGVATKTRMKLSTYIEVCIEPRLKGIEWESKNRTFKERQKEKEKSQKCWYRLGAYCGRGWRFRQWTNPFVLLFIVDLYIVWTVAELLMRFELGPTHFSPYGDVIGGVLIIILLAIRLCRTRDAVCNEPNSKEYARLWRNLDTVDKE